MARREKAVELKHNGYNCCQAVLCAFDDELPLAEDDLNRIGASICKDLKGRDTGVVLCECDDCVRNAVSILEEQDGLLRLG